MEKPWTDKADEIKHLGSKAGVNMSRGNYEDALDKIEERVFLFEEALDECEELEAGRLICKRNIRKAKERSNELIIKGIKSNIEEEKKTRDKGIGRRKKRSSGVSDPSIDEKSEHGDINYPDRGINKRL